MLYFVLGVEGVIWSRGPCGRKNKLKTTEIIDCKVFISVSSDKERIYKYHFDSALNILNCTVSINNPKSSL
jgi:hypothetical protein